MKNKFLTVAGIAICAVALGLNLQNAFDGYGVKNGSLHPEVLAQTTGGNSTTGGSGSATGGSTTGGSTSGGSTSGGTQRTDKFIIVSKKLEEKYGKYEFNSETKEYCRSIYIKLQDTCDPNGPNDCLPATHVINGTDCMSLKN